MAQRIAVEPASLSDEVPVEDFAIALFGLSVDVPTCGELCHPRCPDGSESTDGGA